MKYPPCIIIPICPFQKVLTPLISLIRSITQRIQNTTTLMMIDTTMKVSNQGLNTELRSIIIKVSQILVPGARYLGQENHSWKLPIPVLGARYQETPLSLKVPQGREYQVIIWMDPSVHCKGIIS